MINRRSVVAGLFAAPAIVRAGSLMPIKLVDWTAPFPHRWFPQRWIIYGTSPAMDVLGDIRQLQYQINAGFFYDLFKIIKETD
jgi:hypothetical protein